MIATPGVTRSVGMGGMETTRAVSEEMAEVYLGRNMQLRAPGWDFQGTCLGPDTRRVVETGITPSINTNIAHGKARVRRIGAGTMRVPLACFEQALKTLTESMGIGRGTHNDNHSSSTRRLQRAELSLILVVDGSVAAGD